MHVQRDSASGGHDRTDRKRRAERLMAPPRSDQMENTMDITELLQTRSLDIIARASNALSRAHLRGYEETSTEATRLRLQALYDRIVRCVATKNASPLIRYVEDTAPSRFYHGVELAEAQTAFNVLEEAIWKTMRTAMTPSEFVEGVGLLSTVLGLAKDALARTYVSLASARHAPALDIHRLASVHDAAVPVE